jgi:hypothetical protein
MNTKRFLLFIQLVLLVLFLAACGSEAEPIMTEPAVEANTGEQALPTRTPVLPTNTPEPPTNTPEPPTPTVEPTPTSVPPTATAAPPTPTPQPEMLAEDLWGSWGQLLFTLDLYTDGTYLLTWPLNADMGDEQSPLEFGSYELVDGVLTFRPERYESTQDEIICTGNAYSYRASFSEGDSRFLKLVVEGVDDCVWRARQWYAEPVWQLMEKYS